MNVVIVLVVVVTVITIIDIRIYNVPSVCNKDEMSVFFRVCF